jgi:hypothetical protein
MRGPTCIALFADFHSERKLSMKNKTSSCPPHHGIIPYPKHYTGKGNTPLKRKAIIVRLPYSPKAVKKSGDILSLPTGVTPDGAA